MRASLILIPFALAAAVVAQDAFTPDSLVKQLGDEDYAVREAAMQKLVLLGDQAIPALEDALDHEDLEVRLRAGRALRSIQHAKKEVPQKKDAKKDGAKPAARGSTSEGLELHILNGKVKLRRTVIENGERKVMEYEAESFEALKKKHPELRDVLKNFRVGPLAKPFDFDMNRFWGQGLKFNDDFWRKWQKDMQAEAERMRRLTQRLQEQQKNAFDAWRRAAPVPSGRLLGVLATSPDSVLDAQLGLRGRGVVIERVDKGMLAAELGIERFDILIELNGHEIHRADDVRKALAGYKDGQPLAAKVVRRAKTTELSKS